MNKTACLVALISKSTFLRPQKKDHSNLRPQKKEHSFLRALISKTASLVALISKTASLVGLILVGAHNEEQNRGYTIDEEVRHP